MATGIKATDLPGFIGKVVTVQVNTPDDPDGGDFKEYTGKVTAASADGLCLRTKRSMEIIAIQDILDVELAPVKGGRIAIRWIDDTDPDRIRQHMADRHGIPVDALKDLTEMDAGKLHTAIDHDKLAHRHGVKPRRGPGRPSKYVRPLD